MIGAGMRRARSLGVLAALGTVALAWRCAPVLHAGPGAEGDAILEPSPEQPGAVAEGAADVKKAQALARKKRFADAVAILEPLAARLPSATHDCNLALAYLRAGELTRAQLRWDLARLRGTPPPSWCTTTLAADLAAALRDKGYVPLALSITPPEAVVEVAGLRLRRFDLLWVAPGFYEVGAHADGLVDGEAHVAVAAPSARVTIALQPPAPPPPEIDAAVASDEPPVDAAVTEAPPIDAPPVVIAPVPAAPTRWPAYVGAGVGGLGLLVGVASHLRASGTRDEANRLVAGSDAFDAKLVEFTDQRRLAIAGYAVAAAGLGFASYWWLTHRAPERAPAVGVVIGDGGGAVTIAWPWSTP